MTLKLVMDRRWHKQIGTGCACAWLVVPILFQFGCTKPVPGWLYQTCFIGSRRGQVKMTPWTCICRCFHSSQGLPSRLHLAARHSRLQLASRPHTAHKDGRVKMTTRICACRCFHSVKSLHSPLHLVQVRHTRTSAKWSSRALRQGPCAGRRPACSKRSLNMMVEKKSPPTMKFRALTSLGWSKSCLL